MDTLQCRACNTPIPFGSSFCSQCGKPIDVDQVARKQFEAALDPATIFTGDLSTRSEGWMGQGMDEYSTVPLPPREALFPFLGASIKPVAGNVPLVQGTPQLGGVPSLAGTPQSPGGAMPQAPWQQPSAGGGGPSAAPNAPSASAPMNPHPMAKPHPQHSRLFRKRSVKQQHTPSHHLHHSGHLHDSGPLHSASQTQQKHKGRMHTKSLKRTGRWHSKSFIITTASVCVLGGLALVLIIPLLLGHAQTPPAVLVLNGDVVPGGNVSIQGRNFTPGGTVSFTMDGHLAIGTRDSATARLQTVSGASSLSLVSQFAQQAIDTNGSAVTVKSDGSFAATIQVDPQWPFGSSHVLIATEQSSNQQARLTIMVPRPAQLVDCASSTTTTSIVLGPIPEGQAQPASTGFSLCTTGSGMVQWTASWNQQQAKWLQIDQTGNIQAPLSRQLTISASANGLKAGTYTAAVTFSDQHSLTKVLLNVTFIVRSAQASACLNTSTQTLTFSATQSLANPAAQAVALTNCGASGSWSATSHTDDGANWLNVNPASGQLNAKASASISIAAASSALGQGIYTGQVTFKTGTGIAVVNVMLNVQASPQNPLCISVAPRSLTFSATQGQGDPASQTVAVGNCGPASSWSATTSTNDGANWLHVNTSSGNLAANASANVQIAIASAQLASGTYQGQVTFKMGSSSQTVGVALTILQPQAKPCLSLSSSSLSFTATQGQGNPATQPVTLTNCGPAGSWSASTAKGSGWLGFNPTGNSLNSGANQSITISPSISGLSAGTYNDTINFTMTTSSGAATQSVSVTLTVQPPPPPPPCLSTSVETLSFSGVQGQSDPAPQTVTLSNCGSSGSWTAATANGSGWLTINPASGNLNAGATQDVAVGASIANLNAGTYRDSITFTLTASNGSIQVTVGVALTVQPPPSPPCLQISGITPAPSSDGIVYSYPPGVITVTVTNCGSDAGTLSSGTNVNWLSSDLQSGTTLNAGGSLTITFTPSSTAPYYTTGTGTITLTTGGGQTSVSASVNILAPIQ